MPRPKSELTGQPVRTLGRLTASQHAEFRRLGGAVWLRKVLAQSIEQRRRSQA